MTPLRVLIVEDCEDDALLVLRELERVGHEVTSERVCTAEDLGAALEGGKWDLVLSDHSMPGFNSLAALKLVRERDPDLPFIIVSSAIGEEVAVQAMRAGAHDYIMKSKLARLVPAIERELRDAEVRRQRRQAEQALRESEARHRAMCQVAAEGVLVADLGTRKFVYANPAICRMLGYGEDELKRMGVSDIHPPAALPQVIAEFEAQARGEKTLAPDIPCLHRDGTVIYADISTTKALIDGRPCNVGFFTDITGRKRLEAQLRQSQKLEAVGQLAGGVAHEFNNILMGISGYAQLLLAEAAEASDDAADLERITELAERGGGLAKQLLTFSRSEGSERAVLNINLLVKNCAKMLRKALPDSINLEVAVDPDLGNADVDPGQLEQVLVNLAVNARDAMPDGGQLTIETANTDGVPVGPTTSVRWVTLSVTDTGCGMDQATLDRIFEPFFTTKDVGQGTGLGLATVHGIVQQHDGHVTVRSEPGKSTTFQVYLPRVDAAEQELDVHERSAAPRGSETVLLVEDDAMVRDVLKSFLEKQGYTALAASCPDEAERIAEERGDEVQLLLTDVSMPGSDGVALHRRLTARRPDLKTVFVSGYSQELAARQSGLSAEAAFVQKPFSLGELACALRLALEGSREKVPA